MLAQARKGAPPAGEVSDVYESSTHSGGYYHVTASYWAPGALDALSGLPGLPTLYYGASDGSGLDGEGRATKVTATSGQNPVTGVAYTTSGTTEPIGSLTQVTLGSGDNDTFAYDVNTGRLTQYKFNIGATPQTVQGTLTWNANSTLKTLAITDPFDSTDTQTCNYSYDDLVRIASANCGSTWSQTFSFDPFGNVTKSGSITFNPIYDQTKNWFQSLPGLSYDNNGNLQNDSYHTYTWDAENRLLTVDTVGLTFDALGRMVEQARGSSYTQIVYAPSGGKLALMSGQTLQKAFLALPGGASAVYNSSGLAYYRHPDWLQSSRFESTPSRTMYSDAAYAPFGESYAPAGTTDVSFTGQTQDTVSGLYDFLYREYHPVSGRWIQPDPAGLAAVDPANPQTWNRYAYLANNPLGSIDPFGLEGGCTWSSNDTGGTLTCGGSDGPTEGGDGGGGGQYAPLQDTGGNIGGGSGNKAANNGPQKSPARAKCEAKAEQKYNAAVGQAGSDFKKGFVAGVVGTSAINFAAGCAIGGGIGAAAGTTIAEFTGATSSFGGAAVGCFTGGVDATLNGFVPSLVNGALIGGGVYLWDRYSASSALKQDLQACSQIP